MSTTALSPTARQLWLRSRWFLLGTVVLLLGGLLVAGLNNSPSYPALDPRSPDADGTLAAVQLLRDRGVTVTTTADPSALAATPAGDDTVVVPLPDLLSDDQLDALARAGHRRLVLISPGPQALYRLATGVQTFGPDDPPVTVASASAPGDCTLAEAQRAGTAEGGGRLYQVASGATGCYPRLGHPTLVRTTGPVGGEVIVLGSGRFLSNQRLAQDGNASLALGVLGAQPHLTWFLPDYAAAEAAAGPQQKSFVQLIPDGWKWALVQLALAALLAMAWRARRLGPVVPENLPVVVRAAETTEGRGRLYQQAKARGRAADALRRATRQRLAALLAVPVRHGEPDRDALAAALAARLADGRAPGELAGLLHGPPPTDDAALLRLADDLDALERQVRQP
ncbi:DUF4350 domain-containing protein [Kitasatospora viridis]|uniref:Uncharacterized protein DUF4350 n=1 Tax=Kitasatospora viridis TaxID=281105 RepID=A0A561UK23_9ACTN|nr:DUF4350 domain-containing protein [Kitasatospora viridis]TWF99722.1 uncharacterized protein DUF4350 [Kitasatospora viridis]